MSKPAFQNWLILQPVLHNQKEPAVPILSWSPADGFSIRQPQRLMSRLRKTSIWRFTGQRISMSRAVSQLDGQRAFTRVSVTSVKPKAMPRPRFRALRLGEKQIQFHSCARSLNRQRIVGLGPASLVPDNVARLCRRCEGYAWRGQDLSASLLSALFHRRRNASTGYLKSDNSYVSKVNRKWSASIGLSFPSRASPQQ